jgi:hypothetical protein
MSIATTVVSMKAPFNLEKALRGDTVEYQIDGIRWDEVHFVALSRFLEGVAIIEYKLDKDNDRELYVTGVPLTELRMALRGKP